MNQSSLPPATYITHDTDLCQLVDQLADEPLLAIDTESNSLYAYQEKVCLVQLSTRQHDYIIDPLAIVDMQPLGQLCANPDIEKVFHAAEYDIMTMKRDFGYTFANLFDTMVAARICGYKQIGLGALLKQQVGIKMDKSHQKDNWGKRPLSKSSLRYAQMDTHYLPLLRDHFMKELRQNQHLAEAKELFVETCDSPTANGRAFDPDGFWKIGRPHELSRYQMGILKELFLLREVIAQEKDQPPFKVLGNKALIGLAKADPNHLDDLYSIHGMSSRQAKRFGGRILQAVEKGREHKLSSPPKHYPPNPEITERYTLLHTWRKQRARKRGVESDVIISKQALWEVARRAPSSLDDLTGIKGLGSWRLQTYGPELLNVIQEYNNQ